MYSYLRIRRRDWIEHMGKVDEETLDRITEGVQVQVGGFETGPLPHNPQSGVQKGYSSALQRAPAFFQPEVLYQS